MPHMVLGFNAVMLGVDVPPYGTGPQKITFHVRVYAGYGHLEVTYRRTFDGSIAGTVYVDGVLSPPSPGEQYVDYTLTDQFNTSEMYYSTYKFIEDAPPPPPQTIQAKFFTLPSNRVGQRPSDYAGEDLHRTITVDGASYTSPVTLQLTVGVTVRLSAPGAVGWDYYGVGHIPSSEASYTVAAAWTEFAAFYEAAPPPPPPPPPVPGISMAALAFIGGVALLVVLGGAVIYQQLF